MAAISAPAQIIVGGGQAPVGIPAGAKIWYGATAPPNTVGANGDYYLNTSSYCLYGPMAAGVWPSACATSASQFGYIAENAGNKGAPGGYAALDASALVPAANLPPAIAINGTSVPSNNAPDQTVVTTAPAAGAWTTLPACPDTGGNHLNYSLVTHGFLCGTTGGTAGSVGFGGVGAGTNANALLISGTLGYAGGGQVNANQLSGVSLAGLSTGLLKITSGTGAPSVATSLDVIGTLGFNAENSANKGAAGGYAPLNISSQIPLTNLPTVPYTQTSGVQAELGFTPENAANKSAANGYAPLDTNGLVPAANLPAIAAINGTSVPGNNASDQTVVTTAPSVGAWTALPSCPDAGGNHLNYSSVTHGFVCGNTGGTAGSVSFGGVGTGTNANALLIGGSLSYTGGGQINANQLSGVSLAGLSTGLLKITSGTGAPNMATSSDITSTLGFTPENSANKGAVGGYAPLNSSSQVPLTNLPTVPYTQTSGVQAALGFTPENPANKNAANGYAPLDAGGLLPAANLPTAAVTTATIDNATLPVNVTSITTTSAITSGGNVYANSGSSAAGCLHVSDANAVHDTGICAPGSGVNVLWNLPATSDADGQALIPDGSHNLLWSSYWTMPHATGLVSFAPPAATSGSPTLFTVTAPIHTGIGTCTTSASSCTEVNDVLFGLNRAVQFTGASGSGALAQQRAILAMPPTYSFTAASTITNAATMGISGGPQAGTNATITNSYALWLQGGAYAGEAGTTTNAYGLYAAAPTGATHNYAAFLNGATLLGPAGAVLIDINANVKVPVVIGGGTAPACAPQVAAGTGSPTCTITGTDVSGVVHLTTGTSPTTTAELFSFTFGNTHTAAPGVCILAPQGTPLGALTPYINAAGAPTTTGWYSTSGSTALAATTTYNFQYICI